MTSGPPKVTVVMPVCNGARYLHQAIDSILCQTFADFEFIIIDDGSTDGTLSILNRYAQKHRHIRLIAREHKGLAESLNEGIECACGEWIARMDADDISLPQRFERQLRWLSQTNADICGSGYKLLGGADRRVHKHPESDVAIKMKLLFDSSFAHPTVMMRSHLAKQLRYDKAWEKCEDYDLWERAARAGWKMTNVPETLLLYRQHDAQISTSSYTYQQALARKIRRRYWEFIFDAMKLNKRWIHEVMKLRDVSGAKPDMDAVDAAFAELLSRNTGEARITILDHATSYYFRAAADCPDVVSRWGNLHREFGGGFALGVKLKLWLLNVLRIYPESVFVKGLKKISAVLKWS